MLVSSSSSPAAETSNEESGDVVDASLTRSRKPGGSDGGVQLSSDDEVVEAEGEEARREMSLE
jgi:hypothetical protein